MRGVDDQGIKGKRTLSRHEYKTVKDFEALSLMYVDNLWCGAYHNIAKCEKFKGEWIYYVWGRNCQGQLGLGYYNEYNSIQENKFLKYKNVVDVAAGLNFTVVLTDKGQVFGCGDNGFSQLGLGKGNVHIK